MEKELIFDEVIGQLALLLQMKSLMKLFSKPKTPLQTILSKQYEIDPRISPTQLLLFIKKSSKLTKFIEEMNKKEKCAFRIIRKLCVIHLCLIHNPQLCDSFRRIDFKTTSDDEWLNENIIKPYCLFLHKICCSYEMYRLTKLDHAIEIDMDLMFFVIKLLNDLFAVVRKLGNLGRYYQADAAIIQPFLLRFFVYMHAYHAQEIYASFKVILGEIIRYPKRYIHTKQSQKMLKYLMGDELVKINEQMKNLFLDKHFFPLSKGYGVKLLRLEELPDSSRDYVDSILYSGPARTARPKKKATLDSFIFDHSGKINPELYMSLRYMTMGEETVRKIEQAAIEQEIRPTDRNKRPRNLIENMQTV